jgi:acyl-CoA synthetase (AMP-forming)/AMP-acid ligase II
MNPAEFLTISSAVVPDREALIAGDGSKRILYAEMASRVNRLANALHAMGVGVGDKVALMAVNSPEAVETYYACAKIGACYVPLNPRAKQEEIEYMINTSEAGRSLATVTSIGRLAPGFRPQRGCRAGASPRVSSYESSSRTPMTDIHLTSTRATPVSSSYLSTTAMPKASPSVT